MSSSEGPIRRRRIAGESQPAAPAKKAPAKKLTAKKAPAKKAPAKKAPVPPPVARPASAPRTVPPPVVAKVAAAPRIPAPASRPVAADDTARATIPRRELRWLIPAALVAVAALVAGGWFATDRISGRGGESVVASNQQAARAAGEASQTIFSFTYDKLPEHLTASKALMTAKFKKQFDKIAPALTELAPQRKIQVQAVAREAGALPCGDSCSTTRANILVFVDQARLVGNSKKPTVFGNRITVSMVKQHGSWLVADIHAL